MSETWELPDTRAGFFGKVTSHGDFVLRRLPASFRLPWDGWLQQGLQGSRKALGDAWLETYLSSPIWRFALAPGVCDGNAWAGVLMPSVDRVGRHFPLTIAAGVAGGAPLLEWLTGASDWYAQLEELALTSLHEQFSLDKFDASLQAMTALLPQGSLVSAHQPAVCFPIPELAKLSETVPDLLPTILGLTLGGHSLWWTDGSPQIAPSLLVCKGLPMQLQFTAMLDGSWQHCG
jgi:type VI secretion system protein ImpM